MRQELPLGKLILLGFGALLLCVVLVIGSCGGMKAYGRYQKRADAKNDVSVTHIKIQQATQQAQINRAQIAATRAEAEKRYQAAIGIRRAQDEIRKTLTAYYLQHEAIQAQEAVARSGRNNTVVYVPSGPNGVPLVQNATHPGR